jgi:hypothetical protein
MVNFSTEFLLSSVMELRPDCGERQRKRYHLSLGKELIGKANIRLCTTS